MGQSDVTDADVQLETYIRRQCLRHGTYSTEDVRSLLAAHRHSAVAVLRAEIEAAWQIIESSYDIEPRKQLESEAKKNGFKYGLAQAVFYLWKRDANVAAAVAKREAEIVEIIREAERQRFAKCLLEDPSTVGVYFTAGELITKLQNGGGA